MPTREEISAKKVAEIFADALGREVSPETIRNKDFRARQTEVVANATTKSKPQASPQLIESPRITDEALTSALEFVAYCF